MSKYSCLIVFLAFSCCVYAAEVDRIHFLIPAGPGGGWDGTARGIGDAMGEIK